jgi:hypothetical protein
MTRTPFEIGAEYALQEKNAAVGAALGGLAKLLWKPVSAGSKGLTKFLTPKAIQGTPGHWGHKAIEQGVSHGLFGGVIGAATAEEGERLKGFGKGFASGFAVGAPSGAAGHLAGRSAASGLLKNRMSEQMAKQVGSGLVMGAGYGGMFAPEGERLQGMTLGALGGGVAGVLGGLAPRFSKGVEAAKGVKAVPAGALSGGLGGTAGRWGTGNIAQMGAWIGVPTLLGSSGDDPNLRQHQQQRAMHSVPQYTMQGLSFIPR